MIVTIDSMLRIRDIPGDILGKIKMDLIFKNPEFTKKMKIGIPVWGTPEYIKLLSTKDIDGEKEYIIPRGYFSRLWVLTNGKFTLADARVLNNKVVFPSIPKLRDYQSPALNRANNWESGIVLMPCGAGKTETALAIAAALQQPTLWIAHTLDLVQQSMDRAKARLGLSGNQIGLIQGENMSIGTHITFATVQTLSQRDLSEIKNMFGCIIIDECHLVFKDSEKARMFESVISQFPAFYRFGVTASDHRSDGLIDTMYKVIGPKIYEVSQKDLNDAGNVVIPKVKFTDTEFFYEVEEDDDGNKKMLNVQQLIGEMRIDEGRNNVIKTAIEESYSGSTLVLGDSLEHLRMLKEHAVFFLGAKAAYMDGAISKKERKKIMDDMRAGKYKYLFATYQLAKLGLDVPILDRLILATPKRDKTSIQQAVGRIMRQADGKGTPIVYDIYDPLIPQMKHWARERVKVYKQLGCEIEGGPKVRK